MENTSCNDSVSALVLNGCRTDIDALRTFKLVLTSLSLLLIFLSSIAGNMLVFLIFMKRPALLTISNRFIMNLSVCNCLNTLFVMPFMFASLISKEWIFGDVVCRGTGFLMNTTFAASTLTLVAISIDRYCAVAMPLHYTMRVTSKRSIAMIISVWTAAVVASLPPLLGWNSYVYQADKASCTVLWMNRDPFARYYTLYLVGVTFILPLIVLVASYVAIFRSAKNNFERTRRNSIVPSNSIDDGTQTPLRDGRRRSSTAPILVRRLSSSSRIAPLPWHKDEWKTALTSLLVVSTFIICWVPYFIIIVLESVLNDPNVIYPILELISILLAMSSCAINPFVYVFRSNVARQQLKIILGLRREREEYANESRRGSVCAAIKEGIIRQSSTESDLDEKNIQNTVSPPKKSATLTTLVHVPSLASMRA
ncbi:G-protein coupled receptor 161-like [Ylistrum balloti]|uniref:G-protein coupled receptor 161-like n=1 Tax=Ylistrum balloti TaxID=509963 RepID=UPI002905AB14|nr:G-protein coupled receptor 161-like [Ylistrum balloti]